MRFIILKMTNLKNYKISVMVLLLIIFSVFMTSCLNKKELSSNADANYREAEKLRKEGKDGIDGYYRDVYQERADRQKSSADRMIVDDPYLNFILDAISDLLFDDHKDE